MHSCTENKCKGMKFEGLFLNCKYCNGKIFIECIENAFIQRLLINLNMLVKKDDEYAYVRNIKQEKEFTYTFGTGSPMAISCSVCDKKQKQLKQTNEEATEHIYTKDDIAKALKNVGDKIIFDIQNVFKNEIEQAAYITTTTTQTPINIDDSSTSQPLDDSNATEETVKEVKINKRKNKKNKKKKKKKSTEENGQDTKQRKAENQQQQQQQQPTQQQQIQGVNTNWHRQERASHNYGLFNGNHRQMNIQTYNNDSEYGRRQGNQQFQTNRSFQQRNYVNHQRRYEQHPNDCDCRQCFVEFESRYEDFRRGMFRHQPTPRNWQHRPPAQRWQRWRNQ